MIPHYEERYMRDALCSVFRLSAIAFLFLSIFDLSFTTLGVVKYGVWIEGNELWSYILQRFGLAGFVIVSAIVNISAWVFFMFSLDYVQVHYFDTWIFHRHPKLDQAIRLLVLHFSCTSFCWVVYQRALVVFQWFLLLF